MKKSNVFMFISLLMMVIAAIFFVFALNHPEMSFKWPNSITYIIYAVYFAIVVAMFILSIIFRKK